MTSKKIFVISTVFTIFFSYLTPAFADSYTKEEFLTVLLNYKYSEDYKVSEASRKCGDNKSTITQYNWYLDIDDLNIKGKTNETYVYFNGNVYLLTGKIKKNDNKGIYKINLEGEYASEQASGTADITVTGSVKASNPYTIKKLKIKVKEHLTADFAERECTAKATVKSLDAYTFSLN